MAKKTEEDKSQEKQMEMMMLAQQAQQLQKQLEALEEKLGELELIKTALDDIKNTKEGTEIMVPVSSGIFVKAELKNNKEVAVNVGGNIVVTKTFDGAKGLIKNQSDELTTMQNTLTAEMQKIIAKVEEFGS